jgi:type I restriction enzyme S subunit
MLLKVLVMALSKLGDFIELVDNRNSDQKIKTVFGLNNKKEFMPTVATIDENSDLSKYKIVEKGMFVFSGMQTGRDQNIRLGHSDYDYPFVISPAYTTFKVSNIIPTYFFMIFKSPEMDRYGAFLSDSSVRSNLDWEVFCNIELDIPPIEVQQKVVDVYLAMVANQKVYEKGLDDLKLTCDAFIEKLRRVHRIEPIGQYIVINNEKNSHLKHNLIIGVGTSGLVPPKVEGSENTSNYNIVKNNHFIYNPSRINIGSIGLYKGQETMICSPIYNVFSSKEEILLPEYLMLWFKREEFKRYTTFHSLASVRNNFTLELMSEVQIPIPSVRVQKSIVEVFKTYESRKKINETLKKQINEISSVLIKGSIYLKK